MEKVSSIYKRYEIIYLLFHTFCGFKKINYTFYTNLGDIKNIVLENDRFTSIIYLVIPAKLKKKVNF